MAITTANDIVALSLKDAGVVGVGQSALAEDVNDSFNILNMMLAQWRRKRYLIWQLVDTAFTSTGSLTYTVGSGGNFNIPRPDRLEAAYFRQVIPSVPNQVDYPLKLIQSKEDYSRIPLKTLVSFPESVFYDPVYPTGVVYFYPVPTSGLYEMHILTKKDLSSFATLATTILLPEEFHAALLYNLTARLRAHYRMSADPQIIGLAKDSLQVIRGANAAIPTLRIPVDLARRGIYNVYSDRTY